MQIAKTLWMLAYQTGDASHLVSAHLIPIYAENEQEAWIEAYHWATQHQVTLAKDTMLIHYPNGFTVHKSDLPGVIE